MGEVEVICKGILP